MIECRCGTVLDPAPPEGRWMENPHLFTSKNPLPVPLSYNVMLTREGTKDACCPECLVWYEFNWQIAWSLQHDRQGSKVRYVMGKPDRFKKCPSCGERWRPHGETFCPAHIQADMPCAVCVDRVRKIYGAAIFEYGARRDD